MVNYRLIVKGLVQGVGFRPFVAKLCNELGIGGNVYNAGGIVYINGCSSKEAMDELIHRLLVLDGTNAELPLANVIDVEVYQEDAYQGDGSCGTVFNSTTRTVPLVQPGFKIIKSTNDSEVKRLLPIDIATCPNCERELFDPDNRRYRYPFISCVSCGPRYSLMRSVPYDREMTAMSAFSMCPECEKEYNLIGDIRCYAQTIACDKCGPKLIGYDTDMNVLYKEEAFESVVRVLKDGGIVAIKDPSGYHIAFDPDNEIGSGARLRDYKNRENKPFAVMYDSVTSIKKDCVVSDKEEALLANEARPIVLLDKKNGANFRDADVIKGSKRIGAMLASNPLQLMLMREFRCLVMTSGNISGMPVSVDDDVMIKGLKDGYLDYVLSNDRDILYGLDDSVVQVVKGHTQFIRRSRGYVPLPVKLKDRVLNEAVLSLGGDMKSSFAYGIGDMVYPGGYYGDIEDYDSFLRRNDAISHLGKMLGITGVANKIGDMHPNYVSSKDADVRVQHHHAHVLSVMAEHGLSKAVGVAFDGTGYGTDGTIWGGEFLLCEGAEFKRVGKISPVKLVGGDASAKECDKTAMCYVRECVKRGLLEDSFWGDNAKYQAVLKAADYGVNVVGSTSMGRLFDAVSVILDVCLINTYEAEAPMMLQACAENYIVEHSENECPDLKCMINYDEDEDIYVADTLRLFADVVKCKNAGCDAGAVAFSFHRAVADMVVQMIGRVCEREEAKGVPVALSGGTMNNKLLLGMIIDGLDMKRYEYYINEQVEAGDGGLTLGQMLITTQ